MPPRGKAGITEKVKLLSKVQGFTLNVSMITTHGLADVYKGDNFIRGVFAHSLVPYFFTYKTDIFSFKKQSQKSRSIL